MTGRPAMTLLHLGPGLANGLANLHNARSAGVAEPGPASRRLTGLGEPEFDWVEIASGMGVPAVRAHDADTMVRALGRALVEPGPHLIEAILP